MIHNTNLLVLSRQALEENYIGRDYTVISITDPTANLARIKGAPRDMLRLQFFDVINNKDLHHPAMTREDAKKVVSFVNKWWNVSSWMLVHCEAGISRSAGVAAAIAKAKTGDDVFYFEHYFPNPLCYKLVLDEFKRRENEA